MERIEIKNIPIKESAITWRSNNIFFSKILSFPYFFSAKIPNKIARIKETIIPSHKNNMGYFIFINIG